jgi:hypothetical protein
MNKKERLYRFFYHYNKQNKKMTVHFRKQCLIVKDIACFCDTYTKWNEKGQPNIVMQGFANKVIVSNDTAIIQ